MEMIFLTRGFSSFFFLENRISKSGPSRSMRQLRAEGSDIGSGMGEGEYLQVWGGSQQRDDFRRKRGIGFGSRVAFVASRER